MRTGSPGTWRLRISIRPNKPSSRIETVARSIPIARVKFNQNEVDNVVDNKRVNQYIYFIISKDMEEYNEQEFK